MGCSYFFGSVENRIDQSDMPILNQILTIDARWEPSGKIAGQHFYQRRMLLNLLLQFLIGQM
jgi:hypothetical protein